MGIDRLVDTLLYEGYALYPYTPDATKNSTPTPFGIAYPPAYAAECGGAFDHVRLRCQTSAGRSVTATIRYLEPSGARHEAAERRVELGPVPRRGAERSDRSHASFELRFAADGVVQCCVENTAEVQAGLDRAGALTHSLISVHIIIEIDGGRFVSALESGLESSNTWPVLATPNDDAILGAAIVLPDHPQIAPQSLGNMFDNTEIEEALVLHARSLTDTERESITDPTVREMLSNALAITPESILALHGGLSDADNNPGETRATVGGVTFEKGTKVLLTPGSDRDAFDRMLDGRTATIERIYVDYDDRVHLAVTVDDDPGQSLMRETGRYLFFFGHEVRPL